MGSPYFDEVDTFYMANTFTAPELRAEIRTAEVKLVVDPGLFPWRDFIDCCARALDWKKAKPKLHPRMGFINIAAIKDQCDIIDIISSYVKLRKSGRNFIGCCPIHEDKHPSMTVYPDKQTFHCYGCNRGGDVFSFIQAVENTDFRGASSILRSR